MITKIFIPLFLILVFPKSINAQETELTDSTLIVVIEADDGIPKMTLTLGINFLKAHEDLKEKNPLSKKITYFIFIYVGPGDKFRIDLFKTEVDGQVLGFEGNVWRARIISAMYGAKLEVEGTLEYRVSYTIPINML